MSEYIHIDAPPVRSLTPNEQRVYSLLCDGLTPSEVAKRLGLPLGSQYSTNYDAETIANLITNIRAKGWAISTNSKEDSKMSKGAHLTSEIKAEIIRRYKSDEKVGEIAQALELSKVSVYRTITEYNKSGGNYADTETEKEPADVAAPTDSMEDTLETVSSTIIPLGVENVKSRIPDVVRDACIDYMGTLIRCLNTAADEKLEDWLAEVIDDCDRIRGLAEFMKNNMEE